MAAVEAASVLHVDMDAFFAAAEVRRRPDLAGKPVIVGGTGNRGVVAAASYEARRFGVHSAMPTARARLLCPQGVFLAGDHGYYRELSSRIMALFGSFTPIVEAVSLDEAFLDVSGSGRLFGSPRDIAEQIRTDIRRTEGLSCSVGVAPNKLLAKLASERAKPVAGPAGVEPGAGVVEVRAAAAMTFLHPMGVRALPGVGPATVRGLQDMGIERVADLAAVPVDSLVAAFGKAHGRRLAELAQARDPRPVVASRAPKSLSSEVTFPIDIADRQELEVEIVRQADLVAARLRDARCAAQGVVLKVRFGDFRTVTRSQRLGQATAHAPHLARPAKKLLRSLDVATGVRLLGLAASALTADRSVQLSLEQIDRAPPAALDDALDDLRARFGPEVITPASAHRPGGRRHRPYGPDEDS
jgi:DNA polymerase-4